MTPTTEALMPVIDAAEEAVTAGTLPVDVWSLTSVVRHALDAIEREAAAAVLARVEARVAGLVIKEEGFDEHGNWVTTGTVCGHPEGECGFRAAVLDIIREEAGR